MAALFVALQSIALADDVLDRARQLVQARNPGAAYELLAPFESRRAGEVEFDYLLGIAALDAGDAQHAVFALERVLAVNPNYLQARTEIARAYFELGERENARREFESVRASDAPEAVKQTIDRFLSALGAGPARSSGFLEFGIGTDSNVNSATASGQIAIPAFGGAVATLGPGGSKLADNFATFGGGRNLVRPFAPDWALIAGAAANFKLNETQDQFDTNTLDGNLGTRWSRGKEAVTLGYQGQSFSVDNTRFRDSHGVVTQWQHSYSDARQATAFTQVSDLRYPTQGIRNARREIFGLAYAENLGGSWSPIVFGTIYLGREKEDAAGVPQLGHKPAGIRLGGQMTVAPKLVVFGALSLEQRRYGGPEPLFLVTRRDTQTDLRVGVNFPVANDWALVPQLSYTDNRSNIEFDKFTRTLFSVVLRREF